MFSEVFVQAFELATLITTCFKLDTCLLVVSYTLIEEVCLSLERDHIHKVEWVLISVILGDTELEQKAVCNKPNVLVHQAGVHSDQFNGKRLSHEVVLNLDGLINDFNDAFVRQFVIKMLVKETCKVSVHTLVSRD